MKNLLLTLACVLALTACTTPRPAEVSEALQNPTALAKSLAAARLNCPEKNVTVSHIGAGGPLLFYVASGCNQETQVECINSSTSFDGSAEYSCQLGLRDTALFVTSLTKNLAAADLKCAAKDIQIAQVGGKANGDDSIFAANGCNRTANYHCEDVSSWFQRAKFECKKIEAKS